MPEVRQTAFLAAQAGRRQPVSPASRKGSVSLDSLRGAGGSCEQRLGTCRHRCVSRFHIRGRWYIFFVHLPSRGVPCSSNSRCVSGWGEGIRGSGGGEKATVKDWVYHRIHHRSPSSSLSSSASVSLINASAAFSGNEAGVRYPALLWVFQHNRKRPSR